MEIGDEPVSAEEALQLIDELERAAQDTTPDQMPTDGLDQAEEAEAALHFAGDNSASSDLPNVEFYYGKVKLKDGTTRKTGQVYWIYTIFVHGKRRRISPTKIYKRTPGVTQFDHCPHEGRKLDFRKRSLGFRSPATPDAGVGDDGRLQGPEERGPDELADQ